MNGYDEIVTQSRLDWQSKLVLLIVVPAVTIDAAVKTLWWLHEPGQVAIWVAGLSILLGLATWQLRAATPAAAGTGTAITASLMYSTARFPYQPRHTALVPILVVSLLAWACTRIGRARKEQLGVAERRNGRGAAQVAANLGAAALICSDFAESSMSSFHWFAGFRPEQAALFVAGLAALAEAAADTVSSEVGQAFGGRPRLITTLRRAEPGSDGAISIAGSLTGIAAAAAVAAAGAYALRLPRISFEIAWAGGVGGLILDSVLGATFERLGWLNNDGVNFLSTIGAAACALAAMAYLR